jgi:hypothetical protein
MTTQQSGYCGYCYEFISISAEGKLLPHTRGDGWRCSGSNENFLYSQAEKNERDEFLLDLHRSMRR